VKAEKNKTKKIKKQNKHNALFFAYCSLFFVLCSCQTMSNFHDPFSDDLNFFPLDTGASVYFFANVQEARSILELLPIKELNNNQAKQMLDRTGFAAGAFFPKDNDRQFQIAAWGKYPGNADIVFSVNKNWEKMRSFTGRNYWHSASDRLSIAINSRQAFIAQSKINGALGDIPTDPFAITPGIEIPEGFNDFRSDKNTQNNTIVKAPLSLWIENPSFMIRQTTFGQMLSGLARFPIQQIFINIFSTNENQYETVIRLQLENASQARGMAAVLNIAGGFAQTGFAQTGFVDTKIASLFLANSPVQREKNLDIRSAALSKGDIANILSLFF